jgi:hypothetical protein
VSDLTLASLRNFRDFLETSVNGESEKLHFVVFLRLCNPRIEFVIEFSSFAFEFCVSPRLESSPKTFQFIFAGIKVGIIDIEWKLLLIFPRRG